MDETDMNRIMLDSLNLMLDEGRKERVATDMLDRLNRMDFGRTFGPIIVGLRLSGASDENIIDFVDSMTGLFAQARRGLEQHAYEYRIKEDE